ncbi:hypothetical protein [Aliirhizobium cellulosilyticum]|uniref:Uncharacterized protein n=1 Tax=Aliirhizobium cellulosilyticum TaxID=393664 RepID=A0A7W6UZ71_9HYPH|nr:hypothetical protein [Rhizobium cellulosilyticum]MBB4349383.1 hypothetical protein [Rhizobium cellulosilyticum]MBB4412395.1 hypothetical protein [Rhizobium cellulosilyticum]MBB4447027.1 hypothetical protein [Rhizobium cellulosilyticum]
MRNTSRFVTELLRAANDPTRHDAFHIPSLLQEAIDTITKLRRQIGFPKEGIADDALPNLRAVVETHEPLDVVELKWALREAADAIRALQILVESGFSVDLSKAPNRS